jgi:hypothetical protein
MNDPIKSQSQFYSIEAALRQRCGFQAILDVDALVLQPGLDPQELVSRLQQIINGAAKV